MRAHPRYSMTGHRHFPWAALLVPSVIFGTAAALLPASMLTEEGPVERASALLLFALAAAFAALWPRQAAGPRWHLPVILLLMCGRELDFDKRFLAEGMLQLRLYSGDAPILHKAIGALVVILVLWCGWRLLRRDVPVWWRAVRRRAAWAWWVLGGTTAVMLAKTIDGAGRKLEPWGITLQPVTEAVLGRLEEGMELGFVVSLLIAMALRHRMRDRSR